jgi:hypothetical protein
VTLSSGQSLVGFSSAAQPVLTGPITFTTGNELAFVQLVGTTGTAVNATNSANGTIQGVTIANTSVDACNLSNATGSFNVSNCVVENAGRAGILMISTVGTSTWSVSNSTFTNITAAGVNGVTNTTASTNMTVIGCTFFGGPGDDGIAFGSNSTAGSFNVTVTNNTVQGQNTALHGIEILNEGSTTMAGHVFGNNITGCTSNGIIDTTKSNATTLLRFNGNTLTAFGAGSTANGSVSLAFSNNTSDQYTLVQGSTSPFNVENLALFNSSQGNVGVLVQNSPGSISTVSPGTDGIP